MKHNMYLIGLCLLMGLWRCGSDTPVGPEPEPEPGPDHTTGDLVVDLPGGAKMAFIKMDAGTFVMGADSRIAAEERERPQHEVTLTRGYYLGKYEVTRGQWASVMGRSQLPEVPEYVNKDDYPVSNVSWYDCQAFIDRLNALGDVGVYRLPTEAEWEYAARAGTTTDWPETNWIFADSGEVKSGEPTVAEYIWYEKNSGGEIQVVGLKKPNPWGMYDLFGNVAEWVQDWETPYTSDPQVDPTGLENPRFPVPDYTVRGIRGGHATSYLLDTRSSARSIGMPDRFSISVGFRLVLSDVP